MCMYVLYSVFISVHAEALRLMGELHLCEVFEASQELRSLCLVRPWPVGPSCFGLGAALVEG